MDTYSGDNPERFHPAGGSIPGRSGRSSAVRNCSSETDDSIGYRRNIIDGKTRSGETTDYWNAYRTTPRAGLVPVSGLLNFGTLDSSQLHLNGSRRSALNGG